MLFSVSAASSSSSLDQSCTLFVLSSAPLLIYLRLYSPRYPRIIQGQPHRKCCVTQAGYQDQKRMYILCTRSTTYKPQPIRQTQWYSALLGWSICPRTPTCSDGRPVCLPYTGPDNLQDPAYGTVYLILCVYVKGKPRWEEKPPEERNI